MSNLSVVTWFTFFWLIPTVLVVVYVRQHHKVKGCACPKCGYDVSGLSEHCPECGLLLQAYDHKTIMRCSVAARSLHTVGMSLLFIGLTTLPLTSMLIVLMISKEAWRSLIGYIIQHTMFGDARISLASIPGYTIYVLTANHLLMPFCSCSSRTRTYLIIISSALTGVAWSIIVWIRSAFQT